MTKSDFNLAALADVAPELAGLLPTGRPDDADLTIEPSRSGPLTARLVGPDGITRYLHSRYDPRREAAALADAHIDESSLCYIIFGCGLGYAAAELLARLPADAAVVVVESNLAVLAAALDLHDFSADLRAGRLIFLTCDQPAHIHHRLRPLDLRLIAGTKLVTWPAAEQTAGEFLARSRKLITDYVAFARMRVLTLLLNNEATVSNIANNLGRYVACPPVQILRQRFAGYPAVVVSAGPSLHGRLEQLRRLANRAVIIAVQTALRPLLAAGIRPHFVTSLDYGEISQRFFQAFAPGELAGIHMVAEPKAHCKVLDSFAEASCLAATRSPDGTHGSASPQPMISLLGNDIADLMLGRSQSLHDRLPAGATVAHLSFYLAQYLGCDPIVFVGQDLGFSNHTYYTPGTAIHEMWAGELNRYNSVESMEWQRIVRDPQGLRKLTDVHGRPIYTDELMFVYLQQFERDFATAPQRIIDATGGGVRKAGTQIMDLAEVAEQFATRPLPADAFDYQSRAKWFYESGLPAVAEALTRHVEQIEQLEAVSQETLKLLARLVELIETDPAGFNRTIELIDRQRAWVAEHRETMTLVSLVSQLAEFHKHSADRSLRIKGVEGIEKRKFQLARDRAYVSAIIDGCQRMLKILGDALERMHANVKTQRSREEMQ